MNLSLQLIHAFICGHCHQDLNRHDTFTEKLYGIKKGYMCPNCHHYAGRKIKWFKKSCRCAHCIKLRKETNVSNLRTVRKS